MGGYNTRVDFKGEAYNVRLLATRRAFYTAFVGAPDIRERIERMMEDQHKGILGQIVEGRFD